MLIEFFFTLRKSGLPVTIPEYLGLLQAIKSGVIGASMDDFYHLARLSLVKNEAHFDKYDRAFATYFGGKVQAFDLSKEIPMEWLKKKLQRELSEADRAAIEAMGWDKLQERIKELLKEQNERHEGAIDGLEQAVHLPLVRMVTTHRVIALGKNESRHRSAVKVWDKREFKDYDDTVELDTRNIKVALRRLRKFARQGAAEELALDDTIHATAASGGMLDIKMVPQRHNNVKVLLLMDVGGSMDDHVQRVQELFSAARSEFKHLEFYYFHNCVYDFMWRNNHRRYSEKIPTWDILRKYNKDYKLIFVGDATMSPYEIVQPGGSVEYNNDEAGADWIQRLTNAFPQHVWLNPEPVGVWPYRQSVGIMQQLMGHRMFPMSLQGLEAAMRQLSK